jgi:glycosyltransferase involved in cell wall biosynthesis
MNPQISIVVPVYNAEEFLHRCIDSILNQTFQDFEIILINDGSIDKSGEICDEYAREDNRIKVLHKENARVSAARNDGIKQATGKYLGMVDADDWIETVMYQELFVKAEQFNLDFAMCDFKKGANNIVAEQTQPIRGGYYSRDDIENELFPCLLMFDNIEFPPTITNTVCLFKLEFLKSSNILYDEDIHYCEDALFGTKEM